jgi:hypothetical protein
MKTPWNLEHQRACCFEYEQECVSLLMKMQKKLASMLDTILANPAQYSPAYLGERLSPINSSQMLSLLN